MMATAAQWLRVGHEVAKTGSARMVLGKNIYSALQAPAATA